MFKIILKLNKKNYENTYLQKYTNERYNTFYFFFYNRWMIGSALNRNEELKDLYQNPISADKFVRD